MARFGVLIFALVLAFSSADGWAYDKNEIFTRYDTDSCGYYLDAYSRSMLKGDGGVKGPHEFWKLNGWINGYLTAYNEFVANGKKDILAR